VAENPGASYFRVEIKAVRFSDNWQLSALFPAQTLHFYMPYDSHGKPLKAFFTKKTITPYVGT